jgi:hypothetical protein
MPLLCGGSLVPGCSAGAVVFGSLCVLLLMLAAAMLVFAVRPWYFIFLLLLCSALFFASVWACCLVGFGSLLCVL